jgi:hypothetical protein
MEGHQYRYRAFISYRHTDLDRKWAKWIMSKLEAYRTPKELIKLGTAQRIGRLFRDDDEIPASSDLGNQLEDALRESEYLIVICSPNTPISQWVRQEIQFFQQLGRGDRIIPLLVEGEPEDSFPPELLNVQKTRTLPDGTHEEYTEKIEPLAADVRLRADEKHTATKHRALVRIAAALLKCRFDDLEQREKQRQLKRQRTIYGLVATLLLGLIAGGTWWWDYNHIKTYHYVNYVEHYGIPQGVGPVSENMASKMYVSYMLQYQRRQVIRMIRQTGGQKTVPLTAAPIVLPWLVGVAEWQFQYDQEGQVDEVSLFGATGNIRSVHNYKFNSDVSKATISFRIEDEDRGWVTQVSTLSSVLGDITTNASAIAQHSVSYDNKGLVIQRFFETAYGVKTNDSSGSAGNSYRYNNSGQLESISYLDFASNSITLKIGIAEILASYSMDATIKAISFHDADGAAVNSTAGYNKREYKVDGFKNNIELTHFTADRESGLSKSQNGPFKKVNHYDNNGNRIESSYFDVDNQPTLHRDGYFKVTQEYDATGNLIELAYFDVNSQATLHIEGHWKLVRKYDSCGNVVEAFYLGTDSKPKLGKNGFSKATIKYNNYGSVVESNYFGINDELAVNVLNYAKETYAYDANYNLIEWAYFGIDGLPTLHIQGFSTISAVYDDYGNPTELAYFDVNGQPTVHINGYASISQLYDPHGNKIKQAHFGVNGTPSLDEFGTSKVTSVYDNRGNLTKLSYLGINGEPTLHTDGYSSSVYRYDDKGNTTEISYFGIDGTPTLHKDGYSSSVLRYDTRANLIDAAYLGIDGQPIVTKRGYSKETRKFDSKGYRNEEAYFGVDGLPTDSGRGYAKITRNYDSSGHLKKEAYFDIHSNPTMQRGGYSKLTQVFDSIGNVIKMSYLDTLGNPTLNIDGYYSRTRAYDDYGNVIEVNYFDTDDQPILNNEGFSRLAQTFDVRGNLTEQVYFGLDGEQIILENGYSRYIAIYDHRNFVVREVFYGIKDQLVSNNKGFSSAEASRDLRGHLLQESYFGPNAEPVNRKNKLLNEELKSILVIWRNLVLRGAHQAEKLEAFTNNGFHKVYQIFDLSGNLIQQRFEDKEGKPTEGFDGFSDVKVANNALGLPIRIIASSLQPKAETIALKLQYTPRRNIKRVSFMHEDGSLLTSKLGFAEIVFVYDEKYQQTQVQYLDAKGNILQAK